MHAYLCNRSIPRGVSAFSCPCCLPAWSQQAPGCGRRHPTCPAGSRWAAWPPWGSAPCMICTSSTFAATLRAPKTNIHLAVAKGHAAVKTTRQYLLDSACMRPGPLTVSPIHQLGVRTMLGMASQLLANLHLVVEHRHVTIDPKHPAEHCHTMLGHACIVKQSYSQLDFGPLAPCGCAQA